MSAKPNLLHKTPVYIRQIDRKFTAGYDDNLHEPVGQARREKKPIRLEAQVKIGDTSAPKASAGGVVEDSEGYCLFRVFDLKNAGITLDRGDRIVQIGDGNGKRMTDYYLTKFVYLGHYANHGGPTLIKAFFEDRKPSRQRGSL